MVIGLTSQKNLTLFSLRVTKVERSWPVYIQLLHSMS